MDNNFENKDNQNQQEKINQTAFVVDENNPDGTYVEGQVVEDSSPITSGGQEVYQDNQASGYPLDQNQEGQSFNYKDNYTQNTNYNQNYNQGQAQYQYPPKPSKSKEYVMGMISLITGILSIIPGCCLGVINVIFALPAIILGVIVLTSPNKDKIENKAATFAIVGIVLGAIGLVIILLSLAGAKAMQQFMIDQMF